MRNYILALAGACLLHPALAAAAPQGAAAPPASQGAKAPEKKEITLPEKALKAFVGEYEFGPERTLTITLDSDWPYRVFLARLAGLAADAVSRAIAGTEAAAALAARRLEAPLRRLVGVQGVFARTWASGSMALGMMLMLLALLVSYYFF